MKKSIVIILFTALGILLCYLVYKSWMIFGFWTLTWTGLVSLFSTVIFENIASARNESNGIITFNPKEWPKFSGIIISLTIAYYLYTKINVPNIESKDYTFGIAYLLTLTVLPLIYALYKIIRDKNDFIRLDNSGITYRDNTESDTINYLDIQEAKLQNGIIYLILKDSRQILIKLKEMNFSVKDQKEAFNEISGRITTQDQNDIINKLKDITQ